MTMVYLYSAMAACGTGLAFALLLARPLFATLGDSCSSGRSASFWTVYSTAMMILAPALGVLFMASYPARSLPVEVVFSRSLLFGLLCLLIALMVIGGVLAKTAFKQLNAELKAGIFQTSNKES